MPSYKNKSPWTTEEQVAIMQFKERLQDLDLSNPLLEDRRLINWLRARDLRLDDAENMLRKNLEWREKNNIDTILTSGVVPVEDPVLAAFPAEVFGHAKDGNSVLLLVAGCIDLKNLIQIYGREMSLNVIYFMLETAYADIVQHSTDPKIFKKAYYVADLEGIRLKEYMCADVLDVLISALKALEANYPELLHKAIIINAPFIYPILWNILKPFMSAATLSKVEILGTDQDKIRNALMEHISVSELPRKYGGTGFSERIPSLNSASSSSSKTNIAEEDMTVAVIPAGESLEVSFDIETPKAIIGWTFKTRHYDVGFSVLHKPFLIINGRNNEEKGTIEKIQYKRLNTHKSVQSGSLICDQAGQYILRFDNTYSRLREKTLLYQVEMTQLTTNGNNETTNF